MKVLYLLGYGRSGTTILDNTLGQIPGFFSAGEMVGLWAGEPGRARCACGKGAVDCRIWSRVLVRVADTIPLHRIRSLQARVLRNRHTLTVLRSTASSSAGRRRGSKLGTAVAEYARALRIVYAAIGEVTGAEVIVDSSKRQAGAALLRRLPRITPFIVHMVRDPRGVAYSWLRGTAGDSIPMPVLPPWKSAGLWLIRNVAAERLSRRYEHGRWQRIRYEDFVGDPARTLRTILAPISSNASPPLVGPRRIRLDELHAVAGNPSRFQRGVVELQEDDAWRHAMRGLDRKLVTALTWPLLVRYGYPLAGKIPGGPSS